MRHGIAFVCSGRSAALDRNFIVLNLRSLDRDNIEGYAFNIVLARRVEVVVNENSSGETLEPVRQQAHDHMLIMLEVSSIHQ